MYRLKNSLYGHKQASMQQFSKLPEALLSKVFIASRNDYSLFIKTISGYLIVIVVYVDEILLGGDDLTIMTDL